jgi:Septum formation
MSENGGIGQGDPFGGGVGGGVGSPENPQGPYAAPPVNPFAMPSYPQEQPASAGKRLKPYLGTIIFVAVVGALAGGGWLIHNATTPTRNASGTLTKGGDLGVESLKVGDCFMNPTTSAAFASVTAIPCNQAHTGQTYGIVQYTGTETTLPSDDAIAAVANPLCDDKAKANVITNVPDGTDSTVFTPDETGWDQGDRTIMCVVVSDQNTEGSLTTPGAS